MSRLCLWLVSAALLAPAAWAGGDWPQWRGPNWNGVAPGANPPTTWSETENLAWKVPIEGRGKGTPIVSGQRLFLLAAVPLDKQMPIPDVIPPDTPNINRHSQVIGSWKPQRLEVLCLDRGTGEQLWRQVACEVMPHQGHHNKGCFASQSPVTDGEHLYAYFGSFGLYCYDLEGGLVWKKDFEPQAIEDSLGEGSSPALFGDRLVIVVDTERQSFVVAIDKETGEELWRQDRDETSNWSTPRILSHGGREEVVVNGATVHSYDLATGEPLWSCGGHTASAIPMPAVGHGLVFTASGWQKDLLQAISLGGSGDLTGSDGVAWSLRRGVPYVPCPMLWGDELYVLEDQTFFSCLAARSGEPHYLKHRLPGNPSFSASPAGAGDRIYLASEEGSTVVLRRGTEAEVLAVNELDEAFFASPAIVGDQLYLRGERHLYCLASAPR